MTVVHKSKMRALVFVGGIYVQNFWENEGAAEIKVEHFRRRSCKSCERCPRSNGIFGKVVVFNARANHRRVRAGVTCVTIATMASLVTTLS